MSYNLGVTGDTHRERHVTTLFDTSTQDRTVMPGVQHKESLPDTGITRSRIATEENHDRQKNILKLKVNDSIIYFSKTNGTKTKVEFLISKKQLLRVIGL